MIPTAIKGASAAQPWKFTIWRGLISLPKAQPLQIITDNETKTAIDAIIMNGRELLIFLESKAPIVVNHAPPKANRVIFNIREVLHRKFQEEISIQLHTTEATAKTDNATPPTIPTTSKAFSMSLSEKLQKEDLEGGALADIGVPG